MIQSMTGYGKATVELNDKKVNIEIKSLNSKALDSPPVWPPSIARKRWRFVTR